jgi:hypothetical protein
MVSAPARAPNIGAPHHRSQPHHRDRCRRYRPSATLSRSADSITAVQIKRVGTKHKFIHFVHEIALLDHWNRLGESFPTMYGSGGCLWLAGSEYRV